MSQAKTPLDKVENNPQNGPKKDTTKADDSLNPNEKDVVAPLQSSSAKKAVASSGAPTTTLPSAPAAVSANAFASAANINGPQVMTGRPTSRVLHPGGGGGKVSWTLG